MPELRDTYDHRAASNWIIQPSFTDLQDRARLRARRHRATGTLAVAVLAGLVAVPLLTLPGDDGRDAPAGQPPSPPLVESVPFSISFYDLSHGVAVYQTGDCSMWLSATADGGETWSEPGALPELAGAEVDFSGEPGCRSHRVVPLGPETLLLPLTTETQSMDEWVDPLWSGLISRDAGQTWQEFQPELRTAEAVPDGVRPQLQCQVAPCQETQLGWYDPQTGNPTVLRDHPPAATTGGGTAATVAADGSLWVAGTDAEDGYAVSVSRDRGRSWQTESLGRVDGAAPDSIALAAADGQTAYLASRPLGQPGASSDFYRITDDGQTWHRLSDRPFDVIAALWTAPDGTLVALDGDWQTHLSTDRGETFQDAGLPVQEVTEVAGGFAGWAPDDSADPTVTGYLSEDGLHWRMFEVPELRLLTVGGQLSD